MERAEAIELIRASGIGHENVDAVLERLLPSARIVVQEDQSASKRKRSNSHFGGLPSLPTDVEWPRWDKRALVRSKIARLEERAKSHRMPAAMLKMSDKMRGELETESAPLAFLAQLSLAEIAQSAPIQGWPTDGTLAFFCDTVQVDWGFDPLARGHGRVMYFAYKEELVRTEPPDDLPDTARFPKRKLEFQFEWTIPLRIRAADIDISVWSNDEYAALCRRLQGESTDRTPIHRYGGHPQEIQNEMRLQCQLVSNGLYCGDASGYNDPRRARLEAGAADWKLLLQIDSDNRLGWMWGDVGRLYFWTRTQEIAQRRFERSWTILQCY
jgi:uncharacterized protein YwqG